VHVEQSWRPRTQVLLGLQADASCAGCDACVWSWRRLNVLGVY
jgi:hypothetical protein